MRDSDDWRENRIRCRAGRNNLSCGRTQFFDQASEEISAAIASAIASIELCNPILLAYDSESRWTVLGTHQIGGIANRQLCSFEYADIETISPRETPLPDDIRAAMSCEELRVHLKGSFEFLQLTDKLGTSEEFWVPSGPEAFVFWNILLMMSRW